MPLMNLLAPLFRVQQHALDNAGLDVMGPQVFDRTHGIEGGLHHDAAFHDCAAALVAALLALLHRLSLLGE